MTQRGDAQYTSAAGYYLLVIRQFCARMEHFTAFHLFQRQTVDHIAGAVIARIPARCHHHAERSAFIPLGCFLVQLTFTGCQAEFNQIGLHAQHNRLGFRIAKAAVKFNNLWITLFVDHQARIEKTGVGVAFRRHAFHGWPDDTFHGALMNFIGHYRRRRVSPHSAGVWPGIFIAYAFVILAGGHR